MQIYLDSQSGKTNNLIRRQANTKTSVDNVDFNQGVLVTVINDGNGHVPSQRFGVANTDHYRLAKIDIVAAGAQSINTSHYRTFSESNRITQRTNANIKF
jgi:hypothetical protein